MHDLMVTTFQACILLLFNARDQCSFDEMQQMLNLPTDVLKQAVRSLCLGKHPILLKEPRHGDVDTSDVFTYHAAFTVMEQCVKVPMLAAKTPLEDQASSSDMIVAEVAKKERAHQIEYCVFKMIQLHKRLEHRELVAKAIEHHGKRYAHGFPQRTFTPTAEMVEDMIIQLIQRDDMECEDMDIARSLARVAETSRTMDKTQWEVAFRARNRSAQSNLVYRYLP